MTRKRYLSGQVMKSLAREGESDPSTGTGRSTTDGLSTDGLPTDDAETDATSIDDAGTDDAGTDDAGTDAAAGTGVPCAGTSACPGSSLVAVLMAITIGSTSDKNLSLGCWGRGGSRR
jgi:hypothetical protein